MEEILKRGLIILLVIVIILLFYYILKGILLTKLGKLKNDKKTWLAWIPILSTYYLGKLTINKTAGVILVLLNILTSGGSITTESTTINIGLLYLLPTSISTIINRFTSLINISLFIYSITLIKKLKAKNKNEQKNIIEPETPIEQLDLSPSEENIEILDLSNDKEEKQEFKFTLIILAVILVFAMLLPKISNIFKPKENVNISSTNSTEIKYNETIDGLLTIDNEKGNITAKNIRFYNFIKQNNNIISFTYLPEEEIKNVNDYNLFIQLYDEKKNVIYRAKFINNNTLGRKINKTYTLNLNDDTYKNVVYASIVILNDNDFSVVYNILVCKYISTDGNYNITNKITYNFSKNGLTSYEVDNSIVKIGLEESNTYKESFEKEASYLKDNVEDLTITDTSLKYKLNLLIYNNQEYLPLYSIGTTIKEVKTNEENKNWSCSNE